MMEPLNLKTARFVPVGKGYPDDPGMRESITSEINKILQEPAANTHPDAAAKFEKALRDASACLPELGYVIGSDEQIRLEILKIKK